MRFRNVLAAVVVLALVCPMAWAVDPGDAELLIYLVDDGPYVAGDIVLSVAGTIDEYDDGHGPGVHPNPLFPPTPPPFIFQPDAAAVWLSGYELRSPSFNSWLITSSDKAPWPGGSFLSNWPWDVTFGATGQEMLYVPPGPAEYVLGTKLDMAYVPFKGELPDLTFQFARFGTDLNPREITYVIPEPGAVMLLLSGLVGLLIWRRRAA